MYVNRYLNQLTKSRRRLLRCNNLSLKKTKTSSSSSSFTINIITFFTTFFWLFITFIAFVDFFYRLNYFFLSFFTAIRSSFYAYISTTFIVFTLVAIRRLLVVAAVFWVFSFFLYFFLIATYIFLFLIFCVRMILAFSLTI